MKLEEIKKEMQEFLAAPNKCESDKYRNQTTSYWLEKILSITLPDPDAKLRKVRLELAKSVVDKSCSGYCYYESRRIFQIIDSHLSPKEQEVDVELEAAKQLVGKWVRRIDKDVAFKVENVARYSKSSDICVESSEGSILLNQVAPLGLTIEDMQIPEVEVSERIWVKGGEKK